MGYCSRNLRKNLFQKRFMRSLPWGLFVFHGKVECPNSLTLSFSFIFSLSFFLTLSHHLYFSFPPTIFLSSLPLFLSIFPFALFSRLTCTLPNSNSVTQERHFVTFCGLVPSVQRQVTIFHSFWLFLH